jgi:hypothetical protein
MPIPGESVNASNNKWMFDKRRIGHQQKFCLWPRRCFLSGKTLWFKQCDVITSMITGPGDQLFETFWCDPKEFLLNELKR